MKNSLEETDEVPARLMEAIREYESAIDAGNKLERKAFLGKYPEIADELAEYLEGLSYLHAAAPAFSIAAPQSRATSEPDETLGDFQLVREIGRGGMGVVYEAIQISLGRRVALKVLPMAATFDSRQLRRFENEARAAASLHHTHIVPVFGVGCERGVPFYAMQLIDGRPLSEIIDYLRKHPRPAAGTDTAMAAVSVTKQATDSSAFFRTVATLGVQVADALEYAHQMGIVHRDIKPANLILDGRDHIWITDFGLARIQTSPSATLPGDVVGTLRYMSPEQAAGSAVVDPRSDVYSLGATLYELLTLQPLFDGSDRRECLRKIQEDEPVALRKLNKSMPSELETIVLKAVAKSPGDRYASARELGDDLRRFLDDRPVIARRPSLPDRARKWLRRHPGTVWSSLVILAFLVAGLAVFAVFAAREQEKTEDALKRERQRAREAEERLKLADERFELAHQAADDLIRISENELADKPFLEGPRQRLLECALVYYQQLIDQRSEDPTVQAQLVATQERVKKIVADLAILQSAGQLEYLNQPAVATDLKVTADQRKKLDTLFAKKAAQWGKLMSESSILSPEERRSRLVELPRNTDAEVRRILQPGQLTRLRQIALQLQGTGAFHDREVVDKLGLSPDQRARIRTVEQDVFFGWGQGGGKGAVWRSWEQKVEAATNQILALLSADQVKRWKELIGDPLVGNVTRFPLPMSPHGPPPPRPPKGPGS